MKQLRQLVKKIPLATSLHRWWVDRRIRQQAKAKSAEQIFTEIHDGNAWGGRESVSGPGSDADQTAVIVRELPALLRERAIRSMLDVPCGDFQWMRRVDRAGIDYTGADIVKSLIDANNARFRTDSTRFMHLDLISGPVPRVDLILCRDCLVHLSNRDVVQCLSHIAQSGSTYLLTTMFPKAASNRDITTGHWRPINFILPPFSFPQPLELINEHCTEGAGAYQDKALVLWRIADLQQAIKAIVV
jgi:SAM-dependent methyltransferase